MSSPPDDPASASPATDQIQPPARGRLRDSQDWWAVLLGSLILGAAVIAVQAGQPENTSEQVTELQAIDSTITLLEQQLADPEFKADSPEFASATTELKAQRTARKELVEGLARNPLKAWLAKPGSWQDSPLAAFSKKDKSLLPGLLGAFVVSLLLFGSALRVMGTPFRRFAPAFVVVFLLATFAYTLAAQTVIKQYNLEYALWALAVGLLISNTVGTPAFLRPAVQTEFFIKTGLVILGAEVLFSRLLTLGLPGIFVAWIVTPIVLISTYLFGQYVLKIPSKSLNMVISADMSVCGVSAAIATAAACRAKKEELSLAIGLSLTFTVIMMVVMPAVIRAVDMNPVLGGAWMGGTIDSTGAVAAAGGILGDAALQVAATVKMIQNILIGVTAFGVAVYWVTSVDPSSSGKRPGVMEIWYRFPKFVLGFVAASIMFSIIYSTGDLGQATVNAVISGTSKTMRGWFFCLAFVSIGLETNFRELSSQLKGGKPLVLYVCGQTLNLCLTLLVAWIMFVKVFPEATRELLQ
ncbi:MAG: putative sulfate exporter family transporter [Planctomycetaceae bacterium]|nr:putative sulfate exporter family transporter [Planctomycetaceae bacterium]